MTTQETIKYLCQKKGISIRKLESDLGFGNGTISGMSDKSQVNKIEKIANYFNVSIEYLIGCEPTVPEYEPEFVELIDLYSRLNKEQKKTVLDMLRSFALSN